MEDLENLSNSDLCAIHQLLDGYLENLDQELNKLAEEEKTREGKPRGQNK